MQYTFRALITIETDEPEFNSQIIREARNRLVSELKNIRFDVELKNLDVNDNNNAYRTVSVSVNAEVI